MYRKSLFWMEEVFCDLDQKVQVGIENFFHRMVDLWSKIYY